MIKKYLISLALGASILFSAFEALGYAWVDTNKMSVPRSNTVAVRLPSDKVLIAGGSNLPYNVIYNSAELYDPTTGTFSNAGAMSVPRYRHAGTLLANNKVLVCGGHTNGGLVVKSAELYDPATETWSNAGTMQENRENHTVILLRNGKALAFGGFCGTVVDDTASADLYDPTSNSWAATGAMHDARALYAAVLLSNGKVLVTGGRKDFVVLASAEIYDPATGTWRTTGSMINGRLNHTATLLPDGKVLVTGGNNASGNLSSAEVFDPNTETWSIAGSMSAARAEHTATLLLNGKVLVVGGGSRFVDLYDPATGTWSGAGSLSNEIYFRTATLLQNGDVLVAGGNASGGYCLDTASIYSHLPVVSNMSKSMTNDKALKLGSSDFLANFKDQSKLATIKILQMPINGALKTIDGYSVYSSQEIDVGELFGGGLYYTPNSNFAGNDGITWTGSNGIDYAMNQADVHISVDPSVAAVSIARDSYKNTLPNEPIKFTEAEFKDMFFGFNGTSLNKIKILMLPKKGGVLRFFEDNVQLGQEINATDIKGMSFAANSNWRGDTEFAWSGSSDGLVYSNPAFVSISVDKDCSGVSAASSVGPSAVGLIIVAASGLLMLL